MYYLEHVPWRTTMPSCPRCGYEMDDDPGPVCDECGPPPDPKRRTDFTDWLLGDDWREQMVRY